MTWEPFCSWVSVSCCSSMGYPPSNSLQSVALDVRVSVRCVSWQLYMAIGIAMAVLYLATWLGSMMDSYFLGLQFQSNPNFPPWVVTAHSTPRRIVVGFSTVEATKPKAHWWSLMVPNVLLRGGNRGCLHAFRDRIGDKCTLSSARIAQSACCPSSCPVHVERN